MTGFNRALTATKKAMERDRCRAANQSRLKISPTTYQKTAIHPHRGPTKSY